MGYVLCNGFITTLDRFTIAEYLLVNINIIISGINSETLNLPDTISELALLSKIYELNSDETVDGILVQLPVPRHINEKLICNAVIPTKDVDGFHLSNLGRLCVNLKCHIPPTSAAVMEVLKSTGN